MALAVQVQAQSFLTNGLVAYYPFNGNANDASGNEHNGTNINVTLAPDRFGVLNQCYSFNGTNSHVDIGSSIQLGKPHDAMTISAWFWVSNIINPQFGPDLVIVSDYSGPDGNVTGDWYLFGELAFGFAGSANGSTTNTMLFWSRSAPPEFLHWGQTVLSVSHWHSCTVVVDGQGTTRMYIDGILDSATPYDASLNYLSNPFWRIGADQWSSQVWNVFNGFIDDVRIYNRALSDSEVQQLYVYESGPRVNLMKAVKPSFNNLTLTTNYQLQVSADMSNWTNQGSPFTSTNTSMVYPQYWDVDNWNQLFFRLQLAP